MNTARQTAITMGLCAAFATSLLNAGMQESANDPMSNFDRLDTDANGVLSKQEAQADTRLKQTFENIDVNGDNRVDETEYRAATEAESDTEEAE